MTFGLAIPAFGNASQRLYYLFESLRVHCPEWRQLSDCVVSLDPDPTGPEASNEVARICAAFNVRLVRRESWGWAVANTDNAIRACEADVVFYCNDDSVASRSTLAVMMEFWRRNAERRDLGAASFMVVNAWELVEAGFLTDAREFYPPVWNHGHFSRNDISRKIERGPRVPEFGVFHEPQLTVTLAGWAFAVRKDAYERCGGLGRGGVIEAIGCALWEHDYACVHIQTPPWLHAQGVASAQVAQRAFFRAEGFAEVERYVGRNKGARREYVERWGVDWNAHFEQMTAKSREPRWQNLRRSLDYWDPETGEWRSGSRDGSPEHA